MRIASWNINSVRLRLDLVIRFLEEVAPDVLCLQETKTPDEHFPAAALAERGYGHQLIHGMKGYNGVAMVARVPLSAPQRHDHCGRQDCRHIGASLPDGTEVHTLYVPSGGDVPDIVQNEKFAHKLQFLEEMADWWAGHGVPERPLVLTGDLNVAPGEHDVWSHRALLEVVSHTPAETERLAAVQATLGWIDAPRRFVPPTQKLYSWWSYRARDWAVSNRGRRIDHIWVTPALAGRLIGSEILCAARGWAPKPSDHVPLWVDLA